MASTIKTTRVFSATDCFILMAAAVAATIWLAVFWDFTYIFQIAHRDGALLSFSRRPLTAIAMIADPFLAALTLAWYPLRLRRPRVRWSHLSRQPGVAVALVAVLAWLAGGLITSPWAIGVQRAPTGWLAIGFIPLAASTTLGGFGVLLTWTCSTLAGRWRPEATWVDRLGRAVGVGWLALAIPSAFLLRTLVAHSF